MNLEKIFNHFNNSDILTRISELDKKIRNEIKYLDVDKLLNDKMNEAYQKKASFHQHFELQIDVLDEVREIEKERLKSVIKNLKPIDEELYKLKLKFQDELNSIIDNFKQSELITNELFRFEKVPHTTNYSNEFKLINITYHSYLRTSPKIFFKFKWETYLNTYKNK